MMKNVSSITYQVSRGFSLIEVIVAIGVIGVLGTIFATILVNTFKNESKTGNIIQIKQNGQQVLDRIEKTLKSAESPVICLDDVSYNTVVVSVDGQLNRFRFYPPTLHPNPGKQTNGYIALDYPEITDPTTVGSFCGSGSAQAEGKINLVNNSDLTSGVSLEMDPACGKVFSIQNQAGFKDNITVCFLVKPALNSIEANSQGVMLKTSVQLR